MPFISEEMTITSERMCFSSEEIGYNWVRNTAIFGRNTYYWGRNRYKWGRNSGNEKCRAARPGLALKVEKNRRSLVVVVIGEVFETLFYRGGDFTRQ